MVRLPDFTLHSPYSSADGAAISVPVPAADEGRTQPYRIMDDNGKWELQKKIPDFDIAYTLSITNPGAPVTINLFGANQFLFNGGPAPHIYFPPGITGTVAESSYENLLLDTIHKPFILGAMTLQSANPDQLAQVPIVTYSSSNGANCSMPLHLFSYFSKDQYVSNLIDIYPISVTVTGSTTMSFTLLANTSVTLVLYVKERLNPPNELHAEPPIEYSDDIDNLFSTNSIEIHMQSEYPPKQHPELT